MEENYEIAFIDELCKVVDLSKGAKKFIASNMKVIKLKKGDFLFKTGEVCEYFYFVRSGLLRGFFNYQNTEITTWVCCENSMVTSISGFFTQDPSLESVQCLEKAQLERFYIKDMKDALNKYPELGEAYRRMLELYYSSSEMRSYMARIPIAKERYQFYLKNYCNKFVDRIPKKHLASLLNIRPETLSRLRSSM